MRVLALTATAVLAAWLSGCSKPAGPAGGPPEASGDAAASPPTAQPPAAPGSASKDAGAARPVKPVAFQAPSLAYAYASVVQAPPRALSGLLARHQAACADAGPSLCQVTGSTLEAHGREAIHATLTMRGEPAWIARFRDRVAADAGAAGGRVAHATVATEDLARQVIDVQAAIRAKTALRDRLQTLLETRPGKTADFLEVSTDLSNVQGDLDATQSELAAMQVRVLTSTLSINYDPAGLLTPDGAWAPLISAVKGITGIVAGLLAVLVTCLAIVLPLTLVAGAGVWLFHSPLWRAVSRSLKGSRPAAPAPPAV